MRGAKAKQIRRLAFKLAVEKLKSLVTPDEGQTINVSELKKFEEDQEKYVWAGGTRYLSAYSSRSLYQKIKRARTS